MGEEYRLKVFQNRVLREIFAAKRDELRGSTENYIMRNFMVCTAHQTLFGWLNQQQ